MSHGINITRIKAVNNVLGDLKDSVVYVGGATVSLYADRQAEEARPTNDVDVLVEIATRTEFAALEEQLRKMGFRNDTTAKFIGRYVLQGLIVDVMPTEASILGFSNQWYKSGFTTAMDYRIDDQHNVRIFRAPYFLASKLEAFKHRGKDDGRMSSDFEDIVFVLSNRNAIWEEMSETSPDLKNYLQAEFRKLRGHRYFEEWIYAHTPAYSEAPSFIFDELEKFLQ